MNILAEALKCYNCNIFGVLPRVSKDARNNLNMGITRLTTLAVLSYSDGAAST